MRVMIEEENDDARGEKNEEAGKEKEDKEIRLEE